MLKINVSKTAPYPQPNWPQELKEAGFTGEIDIISDGITAIFINPNVGADAVKASLKLTIKQLELLSAATCKTQ